MQHNLSLEDLSLCKKKIGKINQLTFGIMLLYFKEHIRFPNNKEEMILPQLALQVAKDLDVDPIHIDLLKLTSRTVERNRQDIRKYLGYRVSNSGDVTCFRNYLIDKLLPQHLSDSSFREQIQTYFLKKKIELISGKKLENCILLAKKIFEQRLLDQIFNNLTQENLLLIDNILNINNESDTKVIELFELKKDIAGAKIKNVQGAIDKINLLDQINLSNSIVSSVDRKLLLKYYERIMALAPSNILDFATTDKYATMAIFCHIRLEILLDSLADTMIKLIKKVRTGAEKHVDRYILQEVKRVDGKFDILEKLCCINRKQEKIE